MGSLPNHSPAYEYIPNSLNVPPLGATESMRCAKALIKLFTPDANWTWYIVEYDPDTEECYGLVDGHVPEWGYFSLREIREHRGSLGLPVERDMYFKPTLVSEILL